MALNDAIIFQILYGMYIKIPAAVTATGEKLLIKYPWINNMKRCAGCLDSCRLQEYDIRISGIL